MGLSPACPIVLLPEPCFSLDYDADAVERERRFGLADVEAVIAAPEFFRDGDAYFSGIWAQAERNEPPGQTAALRALAQSEVGMSATDIAALSGLTMEEARHALDVLVRHDVVTQENDFCRFTVELMRRWVAQGPNRNRSFTHS